ncbi:hypothetical protein I3252_04700 [Psychrobacter sp. Ps4]|uniref:hypothetical protein n=1 Tax=Psychrobacter sp. Ps4 TaxID=2790958 RepID=UPI001EDE4EE5|nr:hypothetical protein [Psychrobacter sp. Ps4]MCG3808780.1 hypothetical protein [Psychrobacter sp. Ps4]
MSSINIVHWSNTPLVGSPANISNLTNDLVDYNSKHIVESDYPNNGTLYKEFTRDSLVLNNEEVLNQEIINHFIEGADIVHIHNSIKEENLEKIFRINDRCKYIYHIHSPLKEGPLFFPQYRKFEGIFEEHLTVAQYQPRIYQKFIPVPNIIVRKPSINLIQNDELVRVIYSPTHLRPGRWNNKYSKNMVEVLESLDNIGMIKYINASNMKPDTLFEIRRTCHITIDEIVTGSFHQVSLEGLTAGNLTINAADYFTKSIFNLSIKSNEEIPFYYTNTKDFKKDILNLVANYDLIRDYQKKSFNYAKNNLDPSALISQYKKIYNEVLHDS